MSARGTTRMRAALAGAAAALLAAGCGGTAAEGPPATVLPRADTLTPEGGAEIGFAADLAVDGGRVYVLDEALSQVVRVDAGGPGVVAGARGQGPGEFMGATELVVRGDTLRVGDRGNRRVQVLTTDGAFVRSFRLEGTAAGALAINGRGEVAVATLGLAGARLALLLDGGGRLRGSVGALNAPATRRWNLAAMKEDARRGQVPAALRNRVLPVLRDDGGSWLVTLADGGVQRHDAGGRELWSREVHSPEAAAIRQRFFESNRAEPSPAVFYPLTIVADAAQVDDELWLLLNGPEDEPSVVMVLDPDGAVTHRFVAAAVRGARDLAVDRAGGTLYLSVPSTATVVSVPLPRG